MSTADITSTEVFEPADLGAQLLALIEGGDETAALEFARLLHPADLGAAVASLDTGLRELVLREFEPDELAEVLEFLDPHYRDLLLADLAPEHLAQILPTVTDDIATDVVQELTVSDAVQVVSDMPAASQESIRELVRYAPDTAAGRMTGQHLSVPGNATVEQAIEILRQVPTERRAPTIYVTSEEEKLVGVLNIRALLISASETAVADVAEESVAVAADMDQEDAARLLKQYNVPMLPVVDAEGRVLGTVTADDLLHVLEEEVTEDMFLLAGVNEEEDLESVSRSVRYRLPWLYANLLTVLLAAWVVSLFEGTLERVAVLAAFLPVVAAQGGNAGIQTVTVVIRSLALGRITPRDTLRIVRHEFATGVITGLVSAITVGIVAWLWQDNAWLGGLIAIAVTVDVLIGVVAGVLIPIALNALRQDPAVSAGIWLTTVTDVSGFAVYLGMASLLVTRL
ncbi:MAG: magnesium transporter [Proteobacteria bacterium]|nr:magnesium transporter [Pseudomonadota bacterium]